MLWLMTMGSGCWRRLASFMGISENLILGHPKICRITAVQWHMAQSITNEFLVKHLSHSCLCNKACYTVYLRSSTKLNSKDNESGASLCKAPCHCAGCFYMVAKVFWMVNRGIARWAQTSLYDNQIFTFGLGLSFFV